MDGDLNASTQWKLGTASVDITPSEPMWLAGWAARREPASGTATPLRARALAMEDAAGERLVICTVDLIAITRDIVEPVAAQIFARHGIPREHFLFNASHTHTGPEIRPDKVPFFDIPDEYARKIVPYRTWLIEHLAGIIDHALATMEPVELFATSTSCEVAENRRKPPGPVDSDVPILFAVNSERHVIALLFGYACHNLTLPASFVSYCGEFLGVGSEYIKIIFPEAMVFYLPGAGADINPKPEPIDPTASEYPDAEDNLTRAHGLEIGAAVAYEVLDLQGSQLAGPLRIAYSETQLDFEPLPSRAQLEADLACDDPPKRTKARYLLDQLDAGNDFPASYPCPLQVVSFGNDLLLIAMSAEPVVQYALDFKKQYGPGMVWVAGYCNDMFGYLATREIQEQGGYEGGRATLWSALPGPFTRATEDRVRRAVDELVQKVRE